MSVAGVTVATVGVPPVAVGTAAILLAIGAAVALVVAVDHCIQRRAPA